MEEKVIAASGTKPDGKGEITVDGTKPAFVCTKPFDSENFRLGDDDSPCKNGEA
jgi:hypothetical protein